MQKTNKFDNPYLKAVERKERRKKILIFSLAIGVVGTLGYLLVAFLFPGVLGSDGYSRNEFRYKAFDARELNEEKVRNFLQDRRNVILIRVSSSSTLDTVRTLEEYMANTARYLSINNIDFNNQGSNEEGQDEAFTDSFFETDDNSTPVNNPQENNSAPNTIVPTTNENQPAQPENDRNANPSPPAIENPRNQEREAISNNNAQSSPQDTQETSDTSLDKVELNSSIQFSGERIAGESITFRVANMDPQYYYELDMGNGITQPIIKDLVYTYEKEGAYDLKLRASGPDDFNEIIDTQTLEIEAPANESTELNEEVANTDDEEISTEEVDKENKPSEESDDEEVAEPVPTGEPVLTAEKMPQFPGGVAAMYEYLSRKVDIPNNEAEGVVYVRFIVDEEGGISRARIIQGLSPQVNAAVLKVINEMPDWEPAEDDGKTVSAYKGISIRISKR